MASFHTNLKEGTKAHFFFCFAPLCVKRVFEQKFAFSRLKGQCLDIFDLCFFHQTIPSGPLINGLKPFRIWLRICEVIRQSRCLNGVIDTTEAWNLEFERLWPPLKRISIKKLHRKTLLPYSYNNQTQNIGVIYG
jgi:hypothetical protein